MTAMERMPCNYSSFSPRGRCAGVYIPTSSVYRHINRKRAQCDLNGWRRGKCGEGWGVTRGLQAYAGEEGFGIDEEARRQGIEEYEDLKAMLLRRTWKFGALFSVYLFLVAPADARNASLLELVGCAAGYGYLMALIRDVESYGSETECPMFDAEDIEPTFLRVLAKIGVGYRYSLNGRLLIPIGLVMACTAWNSTQDVDHQISLVEQGCLVGGFLGYKVALFTKIYDDLKPKVLTAEELMKEKRPDLDMDLDDVSLSDILNKRREE